MSCEETFCSIILAERLCYSDIVGDRNLAVWQPALIPLVEDPKSWAISTLDKFLDIPFIVPAPLGITQAELSSPGLEFVDVVKTGFKPASDKNKFPLSRPNTKNKDSIKAAELKAEYSQTAFNYTEKLRGQAADAKLIRDVPHLQRCVRCLIYFILSFLMKLIAQLDTT